MDTRFDHLTCMPTAPISPVSPRLIYSELPRGDYHLDSSPFGINLVIEGEEIYEIDGRRLRVGAGELLVINAGLPVRVIVEGRSINRAICVCLPQELATFLAASAIHSAQWPGAVVLRSETSTLGKELLQCRPASLDQVAAHLLISSVVTQLPNFARTLGARIQNLPGAKPATRRSLLQRLERSYARICLEETELASVEELAGIAGMSLHHFARTFRGVYGLPPSRLQQRLRMQVAAKALANNLLDPREAAVRFGFSEQASFTRAFQRHVGTSPGKLRARVPSK